MTFLIFHITSLSSFFSPSNLLSLYTFHSNDSYETFISPETVFHLFPSLNGSNSQNSSLYSSLSFFFLTLIHQLLLVCHLLKRPFTISRRPDHPIQSPLPGLDPGASSWPQFLGSQVFSRLFLQATMPLFGTSVEAFSSSPSLHILPSSPLISWPGQWSSLRGWLPRLSPILPHVPPLAESAISPGFRGCFRHDWSDHHLRWRPRHLDVLQLPVAMVRSPSQGAFLFFPSSRKPSPHFYL